MSAYEYAMIYTRAQKIHTSIIAVRKIIDTIRTFKSFKNDLQKALFDFCNARMLNRVRIKFNHIIG